MLIISPLHSVTTPTVGLGYLVSSLKSEGINCPLVDLNIQLKQFLQRNGTSQAWLELMFPYGERTFFGELLLSQACFSHSIDQILSRVHEIQNASFQLFFRRLNAVSKLQSPEAARTIALIRCYLESAAEQIAQTALDWIGFSVTVTNQLAVLFLLQRVHKAKPELRIVLGGPHFNRDNALCWAQSLPEVDAVIVGEARSALISWIRGTHGDQYQIIRSYAVDRQIEVAPRSPVAWLPANWSDIKWGNYVNATADFQTANAAGGGAVPVMGARGCSYNRCTFCYEVLLAPRYQPRVVDEVVEEIRYQREFTGRNDFFITDLDLNGDYERTMELMRGLREKVPGIRFHCWLRAHELDEELLQALYEAGGKSWFVGVEAVTDNLLTLMRKGYNSEHARKTIALMANFAKGKSDLRYGFNLIPNYPGETVEDVIETFRVIRESIPNYYGHVGALYEFALTVNTIAWINRHKMGLGNFHGWNAVTMPDNLRHQLPSHLYWYDYPDETEFKRRLIWDHIRVLIGHQPHYIEIESDNKLKKSATPPKLSVSDAKIV